MGRVVYHDVEGGYEFASGVALRLGVSNLTDEDPPFINQANGPNTDAATYRLLGRTFFAQLRFSRGTFQPERSGSSVGVGLGGSTGSYGSGLGLGIGIDLSGKPKDIVTTSLAVQIRKRADNSAIWEGRATTQAKDGSPAAQPGLAAAKLASALFSGYPGKSGETITVK